MEPRINTNYTNILPPGFVKDYAVAGRGVFGFSQGKARDRREEK